MNLVICICTYNRNLSLVRCLKSINNLHIVSNIKIKVIVVDNSTKYISFKLVKKLKRSFKYKIIQLHEKRRGIVYARNKSLSQVKKINPKFICFFDDDCIVDRYWLKNVFKVIKLTNAEIITGPQLPLVKKSLKNLNLINYPQFFERTYKENIRKVNWAATNNVFLEYSVIKKHKLIFDKTLNKFECGEDQLFFSKLNSCGHKIYWSKTIKVFESIDIHRSSLNWLIRRSFRVGVLGYHIDRSIHGRLVGFIINYLKSIYYFVKALSLLFLFFKNKFLIQALNYFFRFFGRLIGPLALKRINFLRK
jgi:succinoglycan biosynthesis protein ExoM|tara:strand:+ start:378 stop:1295 length:918 start_codon:yes stop_codon:yes gene_type:complete